MLWKKCWRVVSYHILFWKTFSFPIPFFLKGVHLFNSEENRWFSFPLTGWKEVRVGFPLRKIQILWEEVELSFCCYWGKLRSSLLLFLTCQTRISSPSKKHVSFSSRNPISKHAPTVQCLTTENMHKKFTTMSKRNSERVVNYDVFLLFWKTFFLPFQVLSIEWCRSSHHKSHLYLDTAISFS